MVTAYFIVKKIDPHPGFCAGDQMPLYSVANVIIVDNEKLEQNIVLGDN